MNDRIQSYGKQEPLEDCHVSMDPLVIPNISGRQALILSLGIFCGTLPYCLEPFITTLCAQQVVLHSSSNVGASEMRKILHQASMRAMVEDDRAYMQLQQILLSRGDDQLAEKTSHRVNTMNEWMYEAITSDLRNWISKPVKVIYGDDN